MNILCHSSIDTIKSAYYVFTKILQRGKSRLSIHTMQDATHFFSNRYSIALILPSNGVYVREILH